MVSILKNLLISSFLFCFTNYCYSDDSAYIKEKKITEVLYGASAKEWIKRATIEDILSEEVSKGIIKFARYNPKKDNNNLDELIYQKNVDPIQRKPVLLLVYEFENAKDLVTKGAAIQLKILVRDSGERLKGVCYNGRADTNLVRMVFFAGEGHRSYFLNGDPLTEKLGVTTYPSFVLYSKFDLLKGESSFKNNGEIKRIDVFPGVPTPEEVIKMIPSMVYWLNFNIFNPNNKYLYRSDNTFSRGFHQHNYNVDQKSTFVGPIKE